MYAFTWRPYCLHGLATHSILATFVEMKIKKVIRLKRIGILSYNYYFFYRILSKYALLKGISPKHKTGLHRAHMIGKRVLSYGVIGFNYRNFLQENSCLSRHCNYRFTVQCGILLMIVYTSSYKYM